MAVVSTVSAPNFREASAPFAPRETLRPASAKAKPEESKSKESREKNPQNPKVELNPNVELALSELKLINELRAVDRQVRAHENAHVAAGGQYITGGPSFQYQMGPDGRRYAVAGEVGIDTSPEDDPQATIIKMRAVRRAALAPADPSAQDRAVASAAASAELQAAAELASNRVEEARTAAEELNGGDDEKLSSGREPPPGKANPYESPAPEVDSALFDYYA